MTFDPYNAPAGHWSRKAEEFADASQGWRWPLVYGAAKDAARIATLRRRLAEADIDRALALGREAPPARESP